MAKREIKFYKHYFNEFYVAQTDKVRKKIAQTLVWLQTLDRLPVTILKSIEGKKDFLKLELNLVAIYSVYSAASMKVL